VETYSPTNHEHCDICDGRGVKADTVAGYRCQTADGEVIGDSNGGGWRGLRTEADCLADDPSNSWGHAYTCEYAARFWKEEKDVWSDQFGWTCQDGQDFWDSGGEAGGCCNSHAKCLVYADCAALPGCDQPDLVTCYRGSCYTGTLDARCDGQDNGFDLGDGGWCWAGRRDQPCYGDDEDGDEDGDEGPCDICDGRGVKADTVAGYQCETAAGEKVGDSNTHPAMAFAVFNTAADCLTAGHSWNAYACEDAARFWAEDVDQWNLGWTCQFHQDFWDSGGEAGGCCVAAHEPCDDDDDDSGRRGLVESAGVWSLATVGITMTGITIATIANAVQEQCALGPTIVYEGHRKNEAGTTGPYLIGPNLCTIGAHTYSSKKTVRAASPRKVCRKYCEEASDKLALKHVQGLTCYCKQK
jgi:hypothetical protein